MHAHCACQAHLRWSSHFVLSSCKSINPRHWRALPFTAQIKWGRSFHKTKYWKKSFYSSLLCSEKWQICGDNARVLSKRQLFTKLSPNESWHREENFSPWELVTFWHLFSLHIESKAKTWEYFAKWNYIKMSIFSLKNVRFSVLFLFCQKWLDSPGLQLFSLWNFTDLFFFNLSVKYFS